MSRFLLLAALFVGAVMTTADTSDASGKKIGKACTFKDKKLQGKVKYVKAFPDFKVQVVSAFPDLKVKRVDAFPDSCGKWQVVDAFPDFTVQIVDAFPDFKIQYVDAFPGVP